ncbi:MAG TPA: hypothetical protein DCG06_12270 [Deltaproteobacteria bacterium]|nr:hypothetical protein [Deltaproteobacteria bacterium]
MSAPELEPDQTQSGWLRDAFLSDWGTTLTETKRTSSSMLYSWTTRKGPQLGNGATLAISLKISPPEQSRG